MICRPGTALTAQWYQEECRRMDLVAAELAANPGNVWGNNPGYPLTWTSLFSVFPPLQLKYLSHVVHDDALLPQLDGHR